MASAGGPSDPSSGGCDTVQQELDATSSAHGRMPPQRTLVRISGLSAAAHLNGACGTVSGRLDPTSGRLPVMLFSPPSAVASHPDGIKIRPQNIVDVTGRMAVRVAGTDVEAVRLDEPTLEGLAAVASRWLPCPVPALFGVPLALRRVGAASRDHSTEIAVFFLIEPHSGFAPSEVQLHGLGPVIIARTDGVDLSVHEMWDVHSYLMHLMNIWPEAAGRTPQECDEWRREMYTPEEYHAYTHPPVFSDDDEEKRDGEEEGGEEVAAGRVLP